MDRPIRAVVSTALAAQVRRNSALARGMGVMAALLARGLTMASSCEPYRLSVLERPENPCRRALNVLKTRPVAVRGGKLRREENVR
jgi:hypothetical protein